MKKLHQAFLIEYWDKFSAATSEADFANILAWLYEENEKGLVEVPFLETVGQVWMKSPETVNRFIEEGAASFPAIMIGSVRNELETMDAEQIQATKFRILPENGRLSLVK